MTQAEKWRTLARILAVTVPIGTLIGFALGWLIGGAGSSMAAGAVIGLLITAGIGTFNVSWAVGLIPRRWREAPFLVVLLPHDIVSESLGRIQLRGVEDSVELFSMTRIASRPTSA